MTVKKFGPKQYKTCHLFAVGPSSPMYIRKLLEFAFRFQSLQQDSCAWLMLEPMSPWGCYQKNIHFWDPSEKFVWVHLGQRKNIVLTKTFQQIYVNWNFMIVYAQRSEIIVVSLFWFFFHPQPKTPMQTIRSDEMVSSNFDNFFAGKEKRYDSGCRLYRPYTGSSLSLYLPSWQYV